MWATIQYESWRGKVAGGGGGEGAGGGAPEAPSMPPIRNMTRKPTAKSIAVVKRSLPRYIVASQLNIFTPVGTAMRKVMKLKKGRNTAPVVNMWCAQTEKPSAPMAAVAKTKAL